MAEAMWPSRGGFEGLLHDVAGPVPDRAGVIVAERTGLGLVSVIARDRDAAAERMRARSGLDLPGPGRQAAAGGTVAMSTGPRSWLVLEEGGADTLGPRLAADLGDAGAVAGQSDGYAVLRLSGPDIRDCLAKGLPIDLHPRAFTTGRATVTTCSHLGIVIWQLDLAPTFEIALFRSYAWSFAHWLADSAAEFGLRVERRA